MDNDLKKERQMYQMFKAGFESIVKALTKPQVELKGVSLVTIKGDKGDKHTDDELLAIIKPLIPVLKQPEDGHTPTDEELLALIRPLIPVVEDGKTPTDERLIALIKPLIPQAEAVVVDEDAIAERAFEKAFKEVTKMIPEEISADDLVAKLQSVKKQWLSIEAIDGDFNSKVTKVIKQWGGQGAIHEAPIDDTPYSRRNGEWVREITVSDTAPVSPYLNQLWYDIS